MKRFKVKRVRGAFVLHVKRNGRWRRQWGYKFFTESMARQFAEGNF